MKGRSRQCRCWADPGERHLGPKAASAKALEAGSGLEWLQLSEAGEEMLKVRQAELWLCRGEEPLEWFKQSGGQNHTILFKDLVFLPVDNQEEAIQSRQM